MRPLLVSTALHTPIRPEIIRYVVGRIKHPHPGSKFAQRTRYVRWLPGLVLVPLMMHKGYDGWVFRDEEIFGEVFFEQRDCDLHIFSLAHSRDEGRGLGTAMIRAAFLEVIETMRDVSRIRLSAGGDPRALRIWEKAGANQLGLPCELRKGNEVGWLYILRSGA